MKFLRARAGFCLDFLWLISVTQGMWRSEAPPPALLRYLVDKERQLAALCLEARLDFFFVLYWDGVAEGHPK